MSSLKNVKKKTNSARPAKPAAKGASAMKWISRGKKSSTSQEGEGSVLTSNSERPLGEGEGSVQRGSVPVASSSTARDECRDSIIAYVHKVSESRRNKRNTMDYSTMVLQTSSDKQLSALIYSKTKRKLLVDSERSRTPVKLQRFTYTSDGSKVIINDMTKISSPQPMEYSFQFEEVGSSDEEKRTAVREIIENFNEGDLMSIHGKVVGVAEPAVTKSSKGSRSLNLVLSLTFWSTTVEVLQSHVWFADQSNLAFTCSYLALICSYLDLMCLYFALICSYLALICSYLALICLYLAFSLSVLIA